MYEGVRFPHLHSTQPSVVSKEVVTFPGHTALKLMKALVVLVEESLVVHQHSVEVALLPYPAEISAALRYGFQRIDRASAVAWGSGVDLLLSEDEESLQGER